MRSAILSFLCLLAWSATAQAQITVSGEGKVQATPDRATVSLSVVNEAPQAEAALDANNSITSKLVKSLLQLGIPKKDLRTEHVQVSPKWLYQDGKQPQITGYTATNTLAVSVGQADLLGRVLDSAVKNGANRIDGISWGFKNPEALLDAARILAVKDARRKADVIANTAGYYVGGLVSVTETSSRFVPRAALLDSARSMSSSIEPGQQTLSVNVNAVWNVGTEKPATAKKK